MEPVEHHIAVRRTARYWSLGGPGEELRELWIVCHGYGQLAERFLRRFRPIATPDRWIVAPEALNRFYLDGIGVHGPDSPVGGTWMTREDRLTDIEDYVAWLDTLHDHLAQAIDEETRITVLGFSQGTATVARWAARTARRIDHVILWAGGLPPELALGPDLFGPARLTLVAGENDPLVKPESLARAHEALQAAGRASTLHTYAGEHDIPADAIGAIAARV